MNAVPRVLFCILASGDDGKRIRAVAEKVAEDDPFARVVVGPGDEGYPGKTQIAEWKAKVKNPGAAVLLPDGSLFKVLTVSQAKSEMNVDKAFADAASNDL